VAAPGGAPEPPPRPRRAARLIATTTRRECLQILNKARRADTLGPVLDAKDIPDQRAATAEQDLLAAERRAALREALTRPSPTPRSAPG
jgi:hypothetical protein